MKIEIDIDLESIIVEALKKKQIADIYVPPVEVRIPDEKNIERSRPLPSTSGRYYTAKERAIAWEFGPKSGHRRTAEERAMHTLERKHGRVLTPEEKGEARALIQMDETAENKAKEDTIRKARIEHIAAEGMAAASKELEAERLDQAPESGPKVEIEEEATIPKADTLETESLFND
jgi:hypothetical protein